MAQTLRERSRARRRDAIQRAALRLFAEGGYDATTVAQVAEAADVSPRTVSLYFPSKLELALSYVTDAAQRLSDACARRTAGQDIIDILPQWLKDERNEHAEMLALLRAMVITNPALRGAETPAIAESRRNVSEALASDLGRTPDDPVVLLVSGALGGTIAALIHIDPDDDTDEAFAIGNELLAEVVRLAQGSKAKPGNVRTAG
jgi:AcrR family transcriptional regulator